MGGEAAAPILARAREHGVVTSADVLAPGEPGLLEWIAPALRHLDYLLPNDEQVLALTGADDLEAGCRALVERGVGCVAATCGADGVAARRRRGRRARAGVRGRRRRHDRLRRRLLGRLPARPRRSAATARDAAALGCAAAALVAQGLGTDHGDFDLAAVEQFETASGRGSVH